MVEPSAWVVEKSFSNSLAFARCWPTSAEHDQVAAMRLKRFLRSPGYESEADRQPTDLGVV